MALPIKDQLSDDQFRVAQLFFPDSLRESKKIQDRNGRFVHYTSALVTRSILSGRNVWMRNASTMNDLTEVKHGLDCLLYAWGSAPGDSFRKILNSLHAGFCDDLWSRFNSWIPFFDGDTFLTCMSEHDDHEDNSGRLSMWRAYARENGVALVMHNTPFMTASSALKAVSSPVAYLNRDAFAKRMAEIVEYWDADIEFMRFLPYDTLLAYAFSMLRYAVLCTKHPGFAEEREWRIIYSPSYDKSDHIPVEMENIDGASQQVCKLPLRNDEAAGLFGAAPRDLLSRLIVGPTRNSTAIRDELLASLVEAGVEQPESKVTISDIPLRT